LRNGSGERALFVPKQFALQQARGDCGTIKFHKGTVLTSAAVVNCARNELLARSGLAQQQNRGIARATVSTKSEYALVGAFPNDPLEAAVAANFLFQVEFFLCELVLEFRNFVVSQCVFNCDCDLS